MKRRATLAALAASTLPFAARRPAFAATAPRRYAVLSLVGRSFDIVTFRQGTISRLDTNVRSEVAVKDGYFDRLAVRAIGDALKAEDPGCVTDLLDADLPDVRASTVAIAAGDVLTMPAADAADIASGGTTHLVLVTPHRDDAHLDTHYAGQIGKGKLNGIGIYYDTSTTIRDADTNAPHLGYCAPFCYARVSLVETAGCGCWPRKWS
jgi:hypothetical protein